MKKPPDPCGSSCYSHSSCLSLVCYCSFTPISHCSSTPISQKHGERDGASTDSSSSSDSDLEAQAAPDSEAESHPQPDPEAASDVDEIHADSGTIVSVKVELMGGKIRPFYCQICFPLPLAGFGSAPSFSNRATLMDLSCVNKYAMQVKAFTVFENSASAPGFHWLPSHVYRAMELAHGAGQIFRDFIQMKTFLFRCKGIIPNPGGLMTKLRARQGGPVRDGIVIVMILFYLLQIYGCIVDWRPVRSRFYISCPRKYEDHESLCKSASAEPLIELKSHHPSRLMKIIV
ncbi:hypothetical protein Cgig2_015339 [Carnegiea gigantea]|uniref:Uncharacterized protein n=1 Tax=Carnegiea gigantea TaxID=171969 RepID=A0A9Q1GUL1_9CARY|nr:hypothetical protein Cgig2_015339 [Carnegiea gigantea]